MSCSGSTSGPSVASTRLGPFSTCPPAPGMAPPRPGGLPSCLCTFRGLPGCREPCPSRPRGVSAACRGPCACPEFRPLLGGVPPATLPPAHCPGGTEGAPGAAFAAQGGDFPPPCPRPAPPVSFSSCCLMEGGRDSVTSSPTPSPHSPPPVNADPESLCLGRHGCS